MLSKKDIEKVREIRKKFTKMYVEEYSTWTVEALQFEYFSKFGNNDSNYSFINPRKEVLEAIILEKLNKKIKNL